MKKYHIYDENEKIFESDELYISLNEIRKYNSESIYILNTEDWDIEFDRNSHARRFVIIYESGKYEMYTADEGKLDLDEVPKEIMKNLRISKKSKIKIIECKKDNVIYDTIGNTRLPEKYRRSDKITEELVRGCIVLFNESKKKADVARFIMDKTGLKFTQSKVWAKEIYDDYIKNKPSRVIRTNTSDVYHMVQL